MMTKIEKARDELEEIRAKIADAKLEFAREAEIRLHLARLADLAITEAVQKMLAEARGYVMREAA